MSEQESEASRRHCHLHRRDTTEDHRCRRADAVGGIHGDGIGGDEARVARARGSGRGALPSIILANGTPSSRVPPPRAGWAVRITEATLTPTSTQHRTSTPGTPRAVERWASERASSALSDRSISPSSPEARRTATGSRVLSSSRVGGKVTAGIHFENHRQEEEELEAKKKEEYRNQQRQSHFHHHHHHHQPQQQQQHRRLDAVARCQAEHLELRGRPMSQNNAIPPLSRPPSTQTTISNAPGTGGFASNAVDTATEGGNSNNGTTNGDDGDAHSVNQTRVHDHNRPFPPPRLPIVHVATVSSTATTGNPPLPTATSPTGVGGSPRILVTAPLSPLSNSFRSRPRQPPIATETPNEANTRGLLSPADNTPPRSPLGEVSLTVPRPDVERTINEYVEAPFKHCCNPERRFEDGKRTADCPKPDRGHRRKAAAAAAAAADSAVAATHRLHSRTQAFRGFNASATSTGTSATTITTSTTTTANAVTKQPVSFTKEPANSLASRTYDPAGLSIMCDFCGRCRCESCREPPPLPSKWLCDNSCFCSADTILDYASCLCCVKGLFYHCADGSGAGGIDGEAAGSCADEPCSCTGNRKASRWACLGALTLVMPCLLCYWPFKGCVAVCKVCYARHAAQGCRCNPNTLGGNGGRHHAIGNDIGDSRDPEKRLLDPVTPEL